MPERVLTEYEHPRPRLTGDERRRGILQAARSEFARVGFYGASTARIAKVAGCSEPMLYKHFAGKLDLFMQALNDSAARAHDIFARHATAGGNIAEQTRTFLEHLMSDPGYLELMQLRRIAVTVDEPSVRDLLVELEAQMCDRIEVALRIGEEQGVVRPGIEPEYVTFCWLGFMQSACYREALEPGAFKDSVRHIATWLRTLDVDVT